MKAKLIKKSKDKMIFEIRRYQDFGDDYTFDKIIARKTKTGIKFLEKLAYDAFCYPYEGIVPHEIMREVIKGFYRK